MKHKYTKQVYLPIAGERNTIILANSNIIKVNMDNPQTPILVKNAGVVLLNNYIPMLFQRLGLTEAKQFKDNESRTKAVSCLHYLTTGLPIAEDYLLSLNNVLCGLALDTPIRTTIDLTDTDKELIESLLKASINHWPSIGQTSISGFRGNWLVRDGLLKESDERWELTVERKPYDVLINRSPFTFSIIKFPWMSKALNVNWPF